MLKCPKVVVGRITLSARVRALAAKPLFAILHPASQPPCQLLYLNARTDDPASYALRISRGCKISHHQRGMSKLSATICYKTFKFSNFRGPSSLYGGPVIIALYPNMSKVSNGVPE